ncbi:MAG: MFS transporter [Bacteroidota bacterium]
MSTPKKSVHPLSWIPTLYFTEGLPYVIVMSLSVIMYKRLELSNTDIALYTSWLYLPWVIKPFWSPFVDILKTKRFWIVSMQLLIGGGLAAVAFSLPTDSFVQYSLAAFWLLAFSSATHDVAADGFYLLALREDQQAFFVGFRSTFYRAAMITGQGLIVVLAGKLESSMGDIPAAWNITFLVLTGIMVIMGLYHWLRLPKVEDEPSEKPNQQALIKEFWDTIRTFFDKKEIGLILAFLLLYRLGESQLVKLASPFLLDDRGVGGLGLATEDVGYIYGTIGVAGLIIGGVVGGILVSRDGLKHWLWWMILAINLPNAVYILLSFIQPTNFLFISACVAVEQLGYGFGFTAFMMYTIYISRGNFQTAHYAFATGFMALGMMIPGMVSGWIQEQLGYTNFFIWVLIATIPSFIVASRVNIDPEFGKKGVEK